MKAAAVAQVCKKLASPEFHLPGVLIFVKLPLRSPRRVNKKRSVFFFIFFIFLEKEGLRNGLFVFFGFFLGFFFLITGWVQQLSHKYLTSPSFIDLFSEDDAKIPATIEHWSYATQRETRADILGLVATVHGSRKRSIVFTQVFFFLFPLFADTRSCPLDCTASLPL